MTRFVVDLGTARISDKQKGAIAAGIQALVLRELAESPPPVRLAGFIPPSWLGFILREELGALEAANREIGSFAAGHVAE